ncbi:MAG: response regulator [Opitutaceae bacterium]|nr:response regulator [Opitutaceae bacterium]
MEQATPHFPTPIDATSPPFSDLRFLIVDDNPVSRFLISKTLLRRFPKSLISECQDCDAALRILEKENVSLIISHRTFDMDGVALVREFRGRNATVPILMMSGIDHREPALAAGANAFLTYEMWLMVGNHVAALLTQSKATGI